MIYSDEELKKWWADLAQSTKSDLIATMVDKMSHSEFALSLANQYADHARGVGCPFSPKQLAAIRKWQR